MVPKHVFEINFFENKFEITVAFFQNYKPQTCRSYCCVEIKVFKIPVFEVILRTRNIKFIEELMSRSVYYKFN